MKIIDIIIYFKICTSSTIPRYILHIKYVLAVFPVRAVYTSFHQSISISLRRFVDSDKKINRYNAWWFKCRMVYESIGLTEQQF